MDRTAIQDLIRQLKSTDENVRLKAMSSLAQEQGEDLRFALASLKDAYLHDPNPAVKYLAAKVLRRQGVDPDSLARGAPLPGESLDPEASASGVLALQGGVRAFWKTAQEYLRTPFNSLCELVQVNPDKVGDRVLALADRMGLDLLLPHLFEIHASRGGVLEAGAPSRLAEVARKWHQHPRESLFPDRNDIRGSVADDALASLLSSPVGLVKALACRHVDGKSQVVVETLLGLFDDLDPMVLGSLSEGLADLGARRRDLESKMLLAAFAHFRPGDRPDKLVAVARLAGRLAAPPTVAFVKSHVAAVDGRARAALIDTLARLRVSDAEKEQIAGPSLKDKDPLVVTRALACLWHSSQRPFITYVLSRYLNHREVDVRRLLAQALGDTGQSDAFGYLVQLLKDPDASVRQAAFISLGRIKGDQLVDQIVPLLRDSSLPVRAASLSLLLERVTPELLSAVRQGMEFVEQPPSLVVRCPPAWASVGETVEIDLADHWVARTVLAAVEALGDPKFTHLAEMQVLSRSPAVRGMAARILWKFGELWAADNVNELLADRDPAAWDAGIEALAEIAEASRIEARLMRFPLLRTALRRHPAFEQHVKKGKD